MFLSPQSQEFRLIVQCAAGCRQGWEVLCSNKSTEFDKDKGRTELNLFITSW